MSRKYFGTDGVRGHVGRHPMTVEFALRLASAAARVLAPNGGSVLIGKDTRLSGYMFESALEAGFVAAGVNVNLIGPLPTPGVAYMTQRFGCDVRRRDQRLAQSLRGQRHQVLRRVRRQAVRRAGDRDREAPRHAADDAESRRLGRAVRVDKSRSHYQEFCASTLPPGTTSTA
jgi:phosphoglucosamine mutase